MSKLTPIEKGLFVKLYNREGYVLNFSTNDFDVFTMESVGIPLCEHYKMSKGKSLVSYINEATHDDAFKLLKDLFEYYELHYESEYKDAEEDEYFGNLSRNVEYQKVYKKCKDIIDRVTNNVAPLLSTATELKEKFSSKYLSKQIDLMISMQTSNPTDAIGKAKELIESCCKTILDEKSIAWSKSWDMGQLVGETLKLLQLLPNNVPVSDPAAETIKAVLGNLRAIATKLAELRNPYGSGHGKSASFMELEERHAKLAVGSSITLVNFLWETHIKMKPWQFCDKKE